MNLKRMVSPRASTLLLLGLAVLVSGCARGAGSGAGTNGGGGGGGGGGVIDPPTGGERPPFLAGLRALVAGPDQLVVDLALPGVGFETALFVSTTSSDVFGGTPTAENIVATKLVVDGLAPDQSYFVGLAVRPEGSSPWSPSGLVLETRTGAPIYVDAAADPNIADGLSPGTAYQSMFLALLVSIGQGGANIFVREGEYMEVSLPLFAGTQVYGGFQGDFDLLTRDPFGGLTAIVSQAAAHGIDVQGGQPSAILDGLFLDGAGIGTIGIDVCDTDVELRALAVKNFAGRGVHVQNGSTNQVIDVRIAACDLSFNAADGFAGSGGLDLRVDGSSLDSNAQEGLELSPLVALDGETARLQVRGSTFIGNG
ncbi:MAG: hypothetical protein ACI8QS_002221, partial [Planctomycetota bacterium]